jgi:hypothetical protein
MTILDYFTTPDALGYPAKRDSPSGLCPDVPLMLGNNSEIRNRCKLSLSCRTAPSPRKGVPRGRPLQASTRRGGPSTRFERTPPIPAVWRGQLLVKLTHARITETDSESASGSGAAAYDWTQIIE